jgi:hypothetical protein
LPSTTRVAAADASAAAGETGTGGVDFITWSFAHLSEVPRQEINNLVGAAAEVRSLIHDDRIRCPDPRVRTNGRRRVRRMRAYRVVPRRDRKTVLWGEPRSRSGSRLRLHDPCFPRRYGKRTRGQHGPAIRGTHVRARSTEPNIDHPAAPCSDTQQGACCWRVQLTLTRSGSRGGSRGVWSPRSAPLTPGEWP